MKRSPGLRAKISAHIATLLLVVILGTGALGLVSLRDSQRELLVSKAVSLARTLALSAQERLARGPGEERARLERLYAAVLEDDRDLVYAVLEGADGTVLARAVDAARFPAAVPGERAEAALARLHAVGAFSRSEPGSRPWQALELVLDGRTFVEVETPLDNGGGPAGRLRLGFSTARLDAGTRSAAVTLAFVLVGFLALGTAGSFWLGARIARPISELARVARRLARKDYAVQIAPRRRGDEVGVLARALDRLRDGLRARGERLEVLVEKRTRQLDQALLELRSKDETLQKELDFAGRIQRSIVPESLPAWRGLAFRHYLRQMGKVGGDVFDVARKGDRLLVWMADVSGHGIPAALITTMAKILFAEAWGRHDRPDEILCAVNQQLRLQLNLQITGAVNFITACALVLEPNLNFSWSCAGHPAAVHYRALEGSARQLEQRGGPMIGVFPDEEFRPTYGMGSLRPGDRLVFFSDGFSEQRDIHGEHYGIARLERALGAAGRQAQVGDVFGGVMNDFFGFAQGSLPGDDVTLLLVAREG